MLKENEKFIDYFLSIFENTNNMFVQTSSLVVPGDPYSVAGQSSDLHEAVLEGESWQDDLGQEGLQTEAPASPLHWPTSRLQEEKVQIYVV